MKRRLYNTLAKWKNDPYRKPLILEGARQVGKTWLLKEFGRKEFKNTAYINCHDNPFGKRLFEQDLNVGRIIEQLALYTNERIVPGKTLIIIDEIQEAPRGIDSLKYFCENAREYHVAVAGSLLGVTHRTEESYPVGKVDILRLYPMSFEEFLWAKGEEQIAGKISQGEWTLLSGMGEKLEELLRQYYFVGGMPEAVLRYVEKGDVASVRTIQKNIIETYSNDFAKHAGRETERIRLVWNSIPAQLAKENKKFVYGAVKKGGRARDFETAIQWLVEAGLVYKVHCAKVPTLPLKFYEDFDSFKLYLLDVGLLGALTDASPVMMFTSNAVFKEYKGAFTENYALQQMKALDISPIYYYKKDKSSLEIDFLLQTDTNVLPIEVKAEENVKSKSLSQFVRVEYPEKNMKGVRFSMRDFIEQYWLENIPLYGIYGYLDKLYTSE